jgi:hypothetical protein
MPAFLLVLLALLSSKRRRPSGGDDGGGGGSASPELPTLGPLGSVGVAFRLRVSWLERLAVSAEDVRDTAAANAAGVLVGYAVPPWAVNVGRYGGGFTVRVMGRRVSAAAPHRLELRTRLLALDQRLLGRVSAVRVVETRGPHAA